MKPDKCVNCGKRPAVITIGDVSYVQCTCGKWNLYEFCGSRPQYAIEQWNVANVGYRMQGGHK